MTEIKLKGKPIMTVGTLPAVGSEAPKFVLTKNDLSELTSDSLLGKRCVLSIFPSIDTPVCATSVRRFNEMVNQLNNVMILGVSADLPFAQARYCGAEGLENVTTLSAFRHPEFGKNYGVTIVDGPLAGLLSRAVLVLDEMGKVILAQQVPEITEEPNYQAVLDLLQ